LIRENFAARTQERWQPPAFRPVRTRADRLQAAARRLLDLQAASIWRDLSGILPAARGAVLDVGAGAQPYRSLLAGAKSYRAIDIAFAGEAFGYEVADTDYYEGDTWPVASASVDMVLATETLEHVVDPGRFLGEARRVLREGGSVVMTVPFAARWHYVPRDYWRFTPSSLRMLLEAAGFEDVVVHARGNELTVACYKVIALLLPGLLPSAGGIGARRVAAVAVSPVMVAIALVAHASMRRAGGDDCLGWTATATAGNVRGRADRPAI
jgi:SAM-dependent methyltransferase